MRIFLRVFFFAALAFAMQPAARAQAEPHTISTDEALDRVLQDSSLTRGNTPFHAVMTITSALPAYSGQIELTWLGPEQYRLQITSPAFKQLRIVNHDQVKEKDDGDFYSRWLESFVSALLDPLRVEANFRGREGRVPVGPGTSACIKRDDGKNGISDELTWSMICFEGPTPQLHSVLTFNYSMEFSDFRSFGKQQIARSYSTEVLDYKPVRGQLTTLEAISGSDLGALAMDSATPLADQINTAFVSTLKEESMIDHPPTFNWPPVREGKTEGYMIVYARTDRNGQVRETSKFNSDNPGLEQFGMEQALTLKFHPLVVNGVAQQMEMPMVLHFTSKMGTPLPELDDQQMRAQISGCNIPHPKPGKTPSHLRVSVNEQGKFTGIQFLDANKPGSGRGAEVYMSLRNCTFAPYLVNGVPTYYHGNLLIP
jgi:hypothetical protein